VRIIRQHDRHDSSAFNGHRSIFRLDAVEARLRVELVAEERRARSADVPVHLAPHLALVVFPLAADQLDVMRQRVAGLLLFLPQRERHGQAVFIDRVASRLRRWPGGKGGAKRHDEQQ
jgi:hypothetical protein